MKAQIPVAAALIEILGFAFHCFLPDKLQDTRPRNLSHKYSKAVILSVVKTDSKI